MPVNANIAMGIRPMQIEDSSNALAKLMQMGNLQQQNQLGALKMDEARSGIERKNKLYGILGQEHATPEAREEALSRAGFVDEATKLGKTRAEQRQADATFAETNGKVLKQRVGFYRDVVGGINSPEAAARFLTAMYQDPALKGSPLTAEPIEHAIASIPTDPASLAKWKNLVALGATKFAELDKPTFQTRNTGGTTDTLQIPGMGGAPQVVGSIKNTQSPDSVASQAEQRRHNKVTEERAATTAGATLSKPFEVTGPEGLPILVRQDKAGNISRVEGFSPKSGGAKMTEDQGKATGWLVQAENAWANMKAVGLDKDGKPTSATQPGFNDALAAIPSFGFTEGVANTMRGANRQKFMQASSSLSESLLRAATGAGVNENEARQKVQELTPVFGESPETTKQKFDAIPLYIESLKVRAGPGAAKAAALKPKGREASGPVTNGGVIDFAELK